ncbi:unnamed protein product [Spirodela intermedia]|uniref:Uncharacterized protein n=1 Tax=Spirodela intermedia TaxID=51605 RepID=A0A7I8JDH4_SPIIN|nr:unnamed protein product [Spirodela intermedia]CAA6668051.1 unnamed protein product [Spirodela intermedia]
MAGLLRNCYPRRALLATQVLVLMQNPFPPLFYHQKLGVSDRIYHIFIFSQTIRAQNRRRKCSDGSDSGEESLPMKDLALQKALEQITATFGKGAIMWLGRSPARQEIPVVSTGSFGLDVALGIGGLPRGRVVEIYGPEASGKTTLALHVIAKRRKMELALSQPDCGEQALSIVDTLVRSGSVDVIVVTVAALVPKAELDGEMGDSHVALQARLMSQALRRLSHSLSLSQTLLVFINQVRMKVNVFSGGFGAPTEVTSGGNALKFYASVRLNIRRIGLVRRGEETTGCEVLVKVVKNKHAPPFKTAQFELKFGRGICRQSEIIELACKHRLIARAGGTNYSLDGRCFRGRDAIKRHLAANDGVRRELEAKLRERIIQPPGTSRCDESDSDDPSGEGS